VARTRLSADDNPFCPFGVAACRRRDPRKRVGANELLA
jgi:hypothetical protein